MARGRRFLGCAIAALSIFLSGCGGGGGTASTPAPAPSPTPTPVATNASIDPGSLSVDEKFTNNAVAAKITKPAGIVTTVTSTPALTIDFVRSNLKYTLTVDGRTAAFVPANQVTPTPADPAPIGLRNDQVYVLRDAATNKLTDRLETTTPDHAGTAYYVTGGVWQQVRDDQELNATAFTYGAETADGSLPRSGTMAMQARLYGQGYWQNDYTYLEGIGDLSVNLTSGAISGSGQARELSTGTRKPVASGDWSTTAQVSSSSNALSGTVKLYQNAGFTISGTLAGRFYGPAGQELGAAFAASGTSSLGAGSVVGVLLGTKPLGNAALTSLTADQKFAARSMGYGLLVKTATGLHGAAFQDAAPPYTVDTVEYKASDGSYVLKGFYGTQALDPIFSTAQAADASISDARFAGFSKTTGSLQEQVRLYRPGSANGELALTYTSFGLYMRKEPAPNADETRVSNYWFAYGVPTDSAAIPAKGTATYQGILYGTASDRVPGAAIQQVTGTSRFDFDFGAGSLTGYLNPKIVGTGGATTDLGQWTIANGALGLISGSPQTFKGSLQLAANSLGGGTFDGTFFGPIANEVAGTFQIGYQPGGGLGNSAIVWGAFAAKKP